MTVGQVVLLVNGQAGSGAAARVAGTVAATLRTACRELEPLVATRPGQVRALAQDAVRRGVDVVAVLGGDGAAHEALQACAGTSTALAVIPAGTGNDLASALGLGTGPLAAAGKVADVLRGGKWRYIDLSRIVGGGWFATVLCAGFDSAVNERVNRMRWPRGARRYDLGILAELTALRTGPLVVETDSRRLELDALLVAVGNTATYGGGIPICPDANPTDGVLDVTVVAAVGRWEVARLLPTLRTGGHVNHPAVMTLRARHVTLAGDNGWIAYADGERQAPLPVSVTCTPGALAVVAPTG